MLYDLKNYKNDSKLELILSRLKTEFNPQKMYLFGSRVNGKATDQSDYDLFLIVESSDLTPIKRMKLAQRLLWDIPVSVDIFIYTNAEFNEWKNELNSVAYTVFHDGLELTNAGT